MLSLDDVNAELDLIADHERQLRIDDQYEEFLEEMYQLWELEQYAADSYNLEYGEYDA